MREPTANRIEQLIKQHMPVGAVGYFFQQITADNQVLRFPETGCFKLIAPFQLPVGVPSGTYQVFFLRSLDDTQPLPPKDPEYPFPEVAFYFAPSPATHAAPPDETPLRRRWTVSDAANQSSELREARIDYRKRRLAMRLQHHEQDMTKSKAITEDLGDAFELNRAYRHELADSAKAMTSVPQRMADDAMKMMDTFRQVNKLSLDMIAEHRKRLEEMINPAPPPPPPWMTLIQQFMPVVLQLGTALLSSTKFLSTAPPELIQTLSMSLAAMSPPATPLSLRAGATSGALPAAQQPLPATQRVQSSSSPQRLPDLPPIADGALTVQDLHHILSTLQQTDTPEARQLLAYWTTLAQQLNPERAAQHKPASSPAETSKSPDKAP